jgi:hypothetical protein
MNIEPKGKQNQDGSKLSYVIAGSILGGGAFWLAWLRFNQLSSWENFYLYGWVQAAGIALIGILSLWAALLFTFGRPSAQSVFKVGLSLIPILLFVNLTILLFRGFDNLLQGNANFFLERLFAQPSRVLLVLVIVMALAVLNSWNKKSEK